MPIDALNIEPDLGTDKPSELSEEGAPSHSSTCVFATTTEYRLSQNRRRLAEEPRPAAPGRQSPNASSRSRRVA